MPPPPPFPVHPQHKGTRAAPLGGHLLTAGPLVLHPDLPPEDAGHGVELAGVAVGAVVAAADGVVAALAHLLALAHGLPVLHHARGPESALHAHAGAGGAQVCRGERKKRGAGISPLRARHPRARCTARHASISSTPPASPKKPWQSRRAPGLAAAPAPPVPSPRALLSIPPPRSVEVGVGSGHEVFPLHARLLSPILRPSRGQPGSDHPCRFFYGFLSPPQRYWGLPDIRRHCSGVGGAAQAAGAPSAAASTPSLRAAGEVWRRHQG